MRQRRQHLFALGFQRIDAQIERRPARHRGRLGDAVIAEYLREIGIEPFRVIARNRRGSLRQRPLAERATLVRRQRLRRKTAAVAQRGDRLDIEVTLKLQHAQRPRPRRIGLHDPGARGVATQHVPDQTGDRGSIAGAGIAVRGAPLLQRLGRRDALRVDGLDQFDGRGEPGSGGHSRAFGWTLQINSRIFSAK